MLLSCRTALAGGRSVLPTAVIASSLALAAACRSEPPAAERTEREPSPARAHVSDAPEPQPAPAAPVEPAAQDRAELAIEHLRNARLREARSLLDVLLIEEDLACARRLVDQSPEDALLAIDELLEIAPRHPEGSFLKGRASLALAEKTIAAGGAGGASLIEGALQDALDYFGRSQARPESAFGAARAATLLGDWSTALEWARRGRELLEHAATDDRTSPAPHRTLAEAFFGAYVDARRAGASAQDVRALYLECEDALEGLLGRTPEDPWVWGRLGDLYEWEGDYEAAEKRIEEGLVRAPEDSGLLERLARVARSAGGPERSVAALEAHVARHPRDGLGAWLLARERFDRAVERFLAGDRRATDFAQAEESFARACEIDPARGAEAEPFAVICRAGRGWCAFYADDLESAERAFLSMNEVFPEGVKWSLPGRIDTGIQGLAAVADQLYQLKHLERAGAVFEKIHALDPEVSTWANNAGLILQDAAVALDDEARRLCALARGETFVPEITAELRAQAGLASAPAGTEDDRQVLVRAANERIERASGLMERSYAAYRDAAALAPTDVRVVNDTALVLIYYLHRDLEHAEELLLLCLEMGRTQIEAFQGELAAGDLPAERRAEVETALYELENAWGDAHQNLGILKLVFADDRAKAREYFERSVEIGPAPRPDVTNSLLPLIQENRELASSEFLSFRDFGRPCE